MLKFTTILHEVRVHFGLNLIEYALCDLINILCTSPERGSSGWCYMSKDNMAKTLTVSRRTIINIINRLCEDGLVEKHESTKHLRTTEKWRSAFYNDGHVSNQLMKKSNVKIAQPVKNLHTHSANSALEQGANSAHNIYTNNINNESNKLYNEILDLFSEELKPKTESIKRKWISDCERLLTIDKYKALEIVEIVRWARSNEFWSGNFNSFLKLRRKDKDGLPYIQRFIIAIKHEKSKGNNSERGKFYNDLIQRHKERTSSKG